MHSLRWFHADAFTFIYHHDHRVFLWYLQITPVFRPKNNNFYLNFLTQGNITIAARVNTGEHAPYMRAPFSYRQQHEEELLDPPP